MLIIADSGFTGEHEVFKFVKLKFFSTSSTSSKWFHPSSVRGKLVSGKTVCLKICNGNLLSMKKKWF